MAWILKAKLDHDFPMLNTLQWPSFQSKLLIWPYKALCDQASMTSLTSSSQSPSHKSIPIILSFLLFFKHVRCAPQGLCIWFFLCMETLPPDIQIVFFLTAFRSLLKAHFLSEGFPKPLFKTASLWKTAFPIFWLWLFFFFNIVLDTVGYNIIFSLFEYNCFLPLSTKM